MGRAYGLLAHPYRRRTRHRWRIGKAIETSDSTTVAIGVLSVDEYQAKIGKSGGKIVMPKIAISGIGWLASCQDTEGNVFGIIQDDSSAC